MKSIHSLLLFIFLFTSCSPLQPIKQKPGNWWETAVFYEIFVRSYSDSDGDGIGDFQGLTQRLDYLNDGDEKTKDDLGITAIWLMPIHPSPSYHGYDVMDYYTVNPEYGTLDDFKTFLSEAHKRGIRVIIDLVLNHTSSAHPWFADSNNDPKSPYHDWFIWKNTLDGVDETAGNTWHTGKSGYYFGLFNSSMPDLNYENPEVTSEMKKVTKFWLENVGVDGFRVDAAKHLIENAGIIQNTSATHLWFTDYFSFYKSIRKDAFTIGEVFGSDPHIVSTYTGNQMDMLFNFEYAAGIINSTKGESNSGFNSATKFIQKDFPSWQFGTFLTNHDQDRVMSVVNEKVEKAKIASTILLTTPGTPFIYYGEEIGMIGKKPDEDIRRPMHWSSDANAGFTSGTPWRDVDISFIDFNVELESALPDSLLSHYKQLIRLRTNHPSLSYGDLILGAPSDPSVLSYLRTNGKENILITINLSGNNIYDCLIDFPDDAKLKGKYEISSLLGFPESESLLVKDNRISFHSGFAPYQILVLQLSK